MNMPPLAAIALLLLCLPGACVTTTVEDAVQIGAVTSMGSLADALQGVSTFTLHPDGRLVGTDEQTSPRDVRRVVESSLYTTFERAGYRLVVEGEAQRYLAYAIGVSGEVSDRELLELFGMSPGIDTVGDDLRGGVILALIDPARGRIVWRGAVSGEIRERAKTPEERDQRIRAALAALLRGLPESTAG